jgi:hypothetical protein
MREYFCPFSGCNKVKRRMRKFVADVYFAEPGAAVATHSWEFNYFIKAEDVFECLDLIRQNLSESDYRNFRVIDLCIEEALFDNEVSQSGAGIVARNGPKEWIKNEPRSILSRFRSALTGKQH